VGAAPALLSSRGPAADGSRLTSPARAAFGSTAAFALIHIPHHDIVFAGAGFVNMLVPLALWVLFMFGVSYLFLYARRQSGSILGAIVCHAGYILGMNAFVYAV
jgi:uncharacterized protein